MQTYLWKIQSYFQVILIKGILTIITLVQHREYGQKYCNSVVLWQMLATLVVSIAWHRLEELLCWPPETDVTLYVTYTSTKENLPLI